MRITTMLAAATTLSTAILAAACDDRPVFPSDVTALPPSFEVVDNDWQPFTWFWWACNEPVTIEGKYHFTWSMEGNDNRWHWRSHMNWIGSGVGEYSGSTFRLSEAYNATENMAAGWTYPLTVSYNDRLKLVGQGPTMDLHGTWQWHVTVNANGVTTAEVDSWEFTCGDHGPPPFEGTLVVNVTDDLDDGSCDPTHCSLREALIASNSHSGTDTIAFNIPGRGPHTIQPRHGLPEVFEPVVIDGTTEPNFAGTPIVELDGSQAGEVHGLTILAGNSTVRGLVINRFGAADLVNGIELGWNGGNVIAGNYIGTDVTGTVALGNSNAGVMVNSPDNLIGGTTAAARNLISGNLEGVTIADPIATGNRVQGNYIGTDASGTEAVGNVAGFLVLTPGNTIGGALGGARNIISGNEIGVNIGSAEAASNIILGNYIGTDPSGTLAVGNVIGIFLSGPGNMIGGSTEGARNVISGNEQAVHIEGADATGNVLYGNYIGTDVTGTTVLGNGGGIHMLAPGNMIGGASPGAGNVISGNSDHGLIIEGPEAMGNEVLGNLIGTDFTGSEAIPNGVGIMLWAPDNMIGSADPGAGNVISGNDGYAIVIQGGDATGNQILGNFIGTDKTGTQILGNFRGVLIDASFNIVGGLGPAARNVIGGSSGSGLYIRGSNNLVQGNYIGTDVTATADLGNQQRGAVFTGGASDNMLGGNTAGAGNTIAFNRGGVRLPSSAGSGNGILSNSIFLNDELGIDISTPGVNLNDPGDFDTGPNELQNFPDLFTAYESGLGVTIEGTLNSIANTQFMIEFFANSECDPSGCGEGETLIGVATVVTDGAGDASFTVYFEVAVPAGAWITATATDPDNNTSEFSACVART
jgi:CSLREA domain-containing protein